MIDIIKGLQQRNPALGPYVLVLRSDSRARDPSDPSRLCAEAEAWIAEKAPGARLSQETVLIAPYPGAMPADRTVAVMAFKDAMQLAAFATAWTADPEPEDEANEDEAGEVEAGETAPNEGTGPEAAPQAGPTGA